MHWYNLWNEIKVVKINKYQEKLLSLNHSYIYLLENNNYKELNITTDNKIILNFKSTNQSNNYKIYIANKSIKTIYTLENNIKKEFLYEVDPIYSSPKSGKQKRFIYEVNPKNKIDELLIIFKNDIADNLSLKIEYNID